MANGEQLSDHAGMLTRAVEAHWKILGGLFAFASWITTSSYRAGKRERDRQAQIDGIVRDLKDRDTRMDVIEKRCAEHRKVMDALSSDMSRLFQGLDNNTAQLSHLSGLIEGLTRRGMQ